MSDPDGAFSESLAGWSEQEPRAPGEETATHFRRLEAELLESDSSFAEDPVVLAEGTEFAGLHIQQKLGSGGMATVYRAYDPGLGEDVALKLLNRGLVRDSRHLQRFRREAQLAKRLRHPRIVTIHSYGELDDCAYLTMNIVEGPTLAEVIGTEGPFEPLRAAQILEQVARAIDAAHQQRVVHRDLKPSNVMLHPEDGPLVLDFGLAKDLAKGLARDLSLTKTGEILGTPAYLAPEQAAPEGRPVDHRVDVHGLGAVLFATLTGSPPHPGETAIEVIRHLLESEPPLVRSINPAIPRALEVICAKALCQDPRDRYQTAGDFADDLARFQAQEVIRGRLPGRLQRLGRKARRYPRTAFLVVASALLLAGGALALPFLAKGLALRQRSQQGLEHLARARASASQSRHEEAEREFLQAMLVTKGAYSEAPGDPELLEALARTKRERAAYAESRGNWGLAEELRLNLARLEGTGDAEVFDPSALIRVVGLRPQARVQFFAWQGDECLPQGEATASGSTVRLSAGRYLAVHVAGSERTTYLIGVDSSGLAHDLHLEGDPFAPGVLRIPPPSLLRRALEQAGEE